MELLLETSVLIPRTQIGGSCCTFCPAACSGRGQRRWHRQEGRPPRWSRRPAGGGELGRQLPSVPPVEGSPEGTAGATKEREEEGGKCRPSKPGEEECKARICTHPRGAIVKGGQGFGLKRYGPILGCFKEGDASTPKQRFLQPQGRRHLNLPSLAHPGKSMRPSGASKQVQQLVLLV